jgi:hypothetical protein
MAKADGEEWEYGFLVGLNMMSLTLPQGASTHPKGPPENQKPS